MKNYSYKVNSKKFETDEPKITGRKILETAGLEPVEEFELLFRKNEKGFEPIQLEEEVDLREIGIEGFKAKPYRKIPIDVDGQKFEVEECFMTPLEILGVVGKDPKKFFLKELRAGNVEVGYEDDSEHKISLSKKSRFFICPVVVEYCIKVNLKDKTWEKPEITYEEVIILAYGSISNDPLVSYTVLYKGGAKGHEKGSLVAGEKVCVIQKMVFNVTQTNRS